LRSLLRHRDARIFLAGQTCSLFGDWALFIVLAVWAKTLTDSNAAAGLVFFALAAPSLVSPAAGLVVDRLPRRRVMIAAHAAVGTIVLSLLFVHGRADLWILYAVAVANGLAGNAFGSARSAFLVSLLPDELLPEANSLLQSVREGLRLVAPLAGAGIYAAAGGGTVAILDAASFGVSVVALLALRFDEPPRPVREHRLLAEITFGARHVFRTLPLRQIVLSVGVALLVVGFAETVLFAVIDQGLHRPPSFFGVLSSVQGVGAIAGGLTGARLLRSLGDGRLVGLGMVLFAIGDLMLASASLPVSLLGMAIAGTGVSWLIVGFAIAIQRRSPEHLQGRVYSAADMLVGTPQTVSIALGAVLSTLLDYRLLLGIMAAVVLGCATYLLTRRTFAAVPAVA
jgi:MFS family permease